MLLFKHSRKYWVKKSLLGRGVPDGHSSMARRGTILRRLSPKQHNGMSETPVPISVLSFPESCVGKQKRCKIVLYGGHLSSLASISLTTVNFDCRLEMHSGGPSSDPKHHNVWPLARVLKVEECRYHDSFWSFPIFNPHLLALAPSWAQFAYRYIEQQLIRLLANFRAFRPCFVPVVMLCKPSIIL